MKKILLKIVLCILTLVLVLMSVVSCGSLFGDDGADGMTKEKALKIISKVALDYTGITLDEVDVSDDISVKKFRRFLNMDKDDFANLMTPSTLAEDNVLTDSKHFFELAASSAYMAIKNAEDFVFARAYDVNFTNAEGNTVEGVDCLPVAVVDAGNGGLYILYYTDSTLTNETVQITYYLNLYGNVSVLKSMAIYSGETEDGRGRIITDYAQFVANQTIETASIIFDFEKVEDAKTAANKLSTKPKTMDDIKENVKSLEYRYATYADETWTANAASVEKRDSWSSFMKDIYKSMKKHIDLYSTDFISLFSEDKVVEVEVPEIVVTPENPGTDPVEPDTDPVEPDTETPSEGEVTTTPEENITEEPEAPENNESTDVE